MNPVVTNPKLLISFLHQTTTNGIHRTTHKALLLISFLHQTTTYGYDDNGIWDCFLSHFYIKPQLVTLMHKITLIASYLISTSNHNYHLDVHSSTRLLLISFLHQTTTVGGWKDGRVVLLLISFLHQTTTRWRLELSAHDCFLSHFYIKPQLRWLYVHGASYCFLSHFYIKPQL